MTASGLGGWRKQTSACSRVPLQMNNSKLCHIIFTHYTGFLCCFCERSESFNIILSRSDKNIFFYQDSS